MRAGKSEMALFFWVLIVMSSILFVAVIQEDSFVRGSKVLGLLIMWTPGIAAMISLLLCRKSLKVIGWKPGKIKYLAIGYFLPICYSLLPYIIGAIVGFVKFLPDKFDSTMQLMLVIGPFINIIGAIGEEIGWRGFLLPHLYKKYSFTKTSFVTGGIWAVWHFPLIIFTDLYSGHYLWLALISFSVYTISITFAYNWLWLASGSIWTVTLLHAVNNLYGMGLINVFEAIDTRAAELFVFDFGIGVPLLCILIAVIFWKLRAKLPAQDKYLPEMISRGGPRL